MTTAVGESFQREGSSPRLDCPLSTSLRPSRTPSSSQQRCKSSRRAVHKAERCRPPAQRIRGRWQNVSDRVRLRSSAGVARRPPHHRGQWPYVMEPANAGKWARRRSRRAAHGQTPASSPVPCPRARRRQLLNRRSLAMRYLLALAQISPGPLSGRAHSAVVLPIGTPAGASGRGLVHVVKKVDAR